MKKYNIIDEQGYYWCHRGAFGFWSNFELDADIKTRVKRLWLFAKLLQMSMRYEGIKTTLKETK